MKNDEINEEINDELLTVFIEETEENLEILEESLLEMEKNPEDKKLLDTVFRVMHNIKGGTGIIGLNKMNFISHNLENILEDIRQGKITITEKIFDLLFLGTDVIKKMINNNDLQGENILELEALLEKLVDYTFENDNENMKDKTNLNVINTTNNNKEQEDKAVQSDKNGETKHSQTVRVEGQKLEDILNDIAELLISQSRVKELTLNKISDSDRTTKRQISSSFEEVDKIIRRVQNKVMSASMIPVSGIFTRMQRLIRDIAKEKNKKVNLIIKGKETELDRKIIERLADPIKHLVRNAVDHGLETPDVRTNQGKPATGTIKLEAFHEEGNIIIKVSDDGAGIKKEKLLKKALEQGIIAEDEKLSDTEIYDLIFKPGFTTAAKVSDVSGRGVGLDVVMTNIKNIRGNVTVTSQENVGSTFTIKLPLTLAIIDGMVVKVAQEKLVIPLSAIIEFMDARKQSYQKVEGKGTIINLRNNYIPYLPLYTVLAIDKDAVQAKNKQEGLLVILVNEDKKLAIQVDEIIGKEQVVIKSVRENMGQAPGINGATIMGDGNVALILDVSSIFQIAKAKIDRIDNISI